MATITYFNALTAVVNFARDNGFEDMDVLARAAKAVDKFKPTTAAGTETKAQKQNKNTAAKLFAEMQEFGKPVTNKLVAETFGIPEIGTTQKAAHILKILVEQGLVEKTFVKGTPTFTVIQATDEQPEDAVADPEDVIEDGDFVW